MVAHAPNPNTQEAESGGFLGTRVSLGYTVKPYFNQNKENTPPPKKNNNKTHNRKRIQICGNTHDRMGT